MTSLGQRFMLTSVTEQFKPFVRVSYYHNQVIYLWRARCHKKKLAQPVSAEFEQDSSLPHYMRIFSDRSYLLDIHI